MSSHIIDGKFQSDKYPTCPPGKVPLSVKDLLAQDLLWRYAQRRRKVDREFADDLETALRAEGFVPPEPDRCDDADDIAAIEHDSMRTAEGDEGDDETVTQVAVQVGFCVDMLGVIAREVRMLRRNTERVGDATFAVSDSIDNKGRSER